MEYDSTLVEFPAAYIHWLGCAEIYNENKGFSYEVQRIKVEV
jgi:hypothetical protein